MQTRVIVAVVLIAVLLCGVANAQNITVVHAGGYDKELGSFIGLSGINTAGSFPITYITIEKVGGGFIQNYQARGYGDTTWNYKINSLDVGTYRVTVRMAPDGTEYAQDEFRIVVPTPEPTPTPTPTPTPDYQAQIAALETRIAAQETTIKAQATMIQEIAVRTPVPTTIPTTVITTETPVPTPTADYDARIAEIQRQVDEQNDIIYQILHFLGLR